MDPSEEKKRTGEKGETKERNGEERNNYLFQMPGLQPISKIQPCAISFGIVYESFEHTKTLGGVIVMLITLAHI